MYWPSPVYPSLKHERGNGPKRGTSTRARLKLTAAPGRLKGEVKHRGRSKKGGARRKTRMRI